MLQLLARKAKGTAGRQDTGENVHMYLHCSVIKINNFTCNSLLLLYQFIFKNLHHTDYKFIRSCNIYYSNPFKVKPHAVITEGMVRTISASGPTPSQPVPSTSAQPSPKKRHTQKDEMLDATKQLAETN